MLKTVLRQNSRLLILSLFFLVGIPVQKSIGQNKTEEKLNLAQEYYKTEEFDKALELYRDLSKNKNLIPNIHENYLNILLNKEEYKEADKYLKKVVKSNPQNAIYNVDYTRVKLLEKDTAAADKSIDTFIHQVANNTTKLRYCALYCIDLRLFAYAEKCYRTGEKNSDEIFYYELADLYANWGKYDLMIDEYMKLLLIKPDQLEYVQMALQDRLLTEEDFDLLEPKLLTLVQKNSSMTVFNEMIVWYYLQQKKFYGAFVQARALDKRLRLEGYKILEIGRLAKNNADYKNASKIFQYLVDRYKEYAVYPVARKYLIETKESIVKSTYPIDKDQIHSLVNDYQQIIDEMGITDQTGEALRNMALLQAFYLDEKDEAIVELKELINNRSIPKSLISQAKLDLGDIYLLKNDPWEASLLYSQVSKANKEMKIGHIAKLKNAKIYYYTGDFKLAQSQLDVLKLATSRTISNDAIALSMLISDNLNLDTTSFAMEAYAEVDLLIFQGKYIEALESYEQMLVDFKGHSLTDEILWEKAHLLIKLGKYEEALEPLKEILEFYGEDILADDANYLIGTIYQDNLNDKTEAMEYFKNHLIDFKGSSYEVDARKRFRQLRGDNVNK
ncbi:tetratricopeptide repeat protein [Flammeovirga kamogawensis]|uniref:Tetratricopeptide repeat protein n=1 Tax=Flammeovirga kamogawensis TaxID=373891 RepID=A0ABX8GRH3_9BACT|nr:tetratricopeptide repeat protein [Flammeovirga kamogawensis]MBB6463807.1 tetratricopeptide (TPR) repeat protein [Flammeovirga kamogawensis]QWG06174.1 tetratricopeptide repeat protein [Flammeovirga kamogawensis]TRX68005.1 tetratricopeptide repeat protein [Flammeovirga kamogawensis]